MVETTHKFEISSFMGEWAVPDSGPRDDIRACVGGATVGLWAL